jgi:hypothetical protein
MRKAPSTDYSIPAHTYADLVLAILLRQHRSFSALVQRLSSLRKIPAYVRGLENIPQRGPGLITVNHYHSEHFWSPWIPLSVSSQVPAEVYWTITNAWTFPGRRLARLLRPASHWLLMKLARVYGLNPMPPMPPAPEDVVERATSVRRIVQYVRENANALIGYAPEGSDQPGGVLSMPPDGAGRLALAVTRRGMPVYPAGIYEDENNRPCLCFGQPYSLCVDENRSERADWQARIQMMRAIAGCLPEALRGGFQPEKE